MLIENAGTFTIAFYFRINIKYSLPGIYSVVQASPFKTFPGCRAYGRSILFDIFSGRKLLSWGAARKTASEKIWAKCEERKHFSPMFSLAVFWAMPQLAERLEEANLFLVTHVSINFRPKSFPGHG